MPNPLSPMPNYQLPTTNPPCPMPNAQFPNHYEYYRLRQHKYGLGSNSTSFTDCWRNFVRIRFFSSSWW
ncbi:MAG: hypothetical protein AAF630_01110 [Cyanobacteria bacterium P01_C01_bin.38]